MNYKNPIVRGMYPDPSVCKANGRYYMVCSTFQLFPGVPLFESHDMVNWKQIGHCLTRESQFDLEQIRSSGGIYAPTIRYHQGRFYMVTTNDSTNQNFYVYTDDIYGEWSEPILVEQGGIDPSLYFEGDQTYFISNESDAQGIGCIQMCEIDSVTGKKKIDTKILWYGTGGRYLEAPHLYRFGEWYYLIDAEGGTEYGHMVNCARSKTIWGPYEAYSENPILTNRNLGGYVLQGAGHGDIIEDNNGNWWFAHLAFRQIDRWLTFHHLGREVCLEPIEWQEDGWFHIGYNGTAKAEVKLSDSIKFEVQDFSYCKTFASLQWDKDWCYLRFPNKSNYREERDTLSLRGTRTTLFEAASPSFIALRQNEFDVDISCTILPGQQESGISLYMDESHHYDFVIKKDSTKVQVSVRYAIGCVTGQISETAVETEKIQLHMKADALNYYFSFEQEEKQIDMGRLETRYLSSEVAGGFTGVLIGLYAVDPEEKDQWTIFSDLCITHKE